MGSSIPRSTWLAFAGLLSINLMVAIDLTVLASALPIIARDLHANNTATYWSSTSFVLCSAVFQPVFTSLCTLGRKASVLIALTLFTVGTIINALAHSIGTLIGGRCIQGIGGGGLLVLTYVVMADLFPLEQRSRLYALVSIMWLVGAVVGPVTGGGFAYNVSWRWIFWLNLPFAGLSYVLIVAFLRIPSSNSEQSFADKLKAIDWIGMVLFATSITMLLIGLSWGGIMFAWSSIATLIPLILGILLLLVWAMYSYGICKSPMIPLIVLADRTAAISYFGTILQGMIFFGLLYYLPLYYQTAKGYSPVISGLASLPQCILSGPSTAFTSTMIGKTHIIKPFSIVGWLLFVYGTATLNILNSETTIWGWIVLNIPSGIGIGILFASLALATQASAEARADLPYAERMKVKAVAAGLNPFFRALGQAFGIAICQAAFTNELNRRLGKSVANDAASFVEVIRNMPANDPSKPALVSAFVQSLRVVWWILFSLSCLMAILTFFTRDCEMKTTEEEQMQMLEKPRSFRSDEEATLGRGSMMHSDDIKFMDSRHGSTDKLSYSSTDLSQRARRTSSISGNAEGFRLSERS